MADVALDLGITEQTVYNWRRQDRIDRGLEAGLSTAERSELAAARKRLRDLEAELAVHRRATELLKENADRKALRGHHRDVRRGAPDPGRLPGAGRVGIGLSRLAPPTAVAPGVLHALLTDLIVEIHTSSRGVYGARRVHAELTFGFGFRPDTARSRC